LRRRDSRNRFVWSDAVLLLVSLAAGFWVVTRSTKDLVRTLRLEPFEMPIWTIPQLGKVMTLRERYAEAYPRSPLSWINRSRSIEALERRLARFQTSVMPFLAVVSPGIGLVATRRRKGRFSRSRIGPGQVAGAVALFGSVVGLASEYLMRRSYLTGYPDLHYDLEGAWWLILNWVGTAILAAWILLLFSGHWKQGRGWREWLGRGLGLAWLAALLWQNFLEPLSQLS
jgi:hypothetical protein